jgi:hypothetical protein
MPVEFDMRNPKRLRVRQVFGMALFMGGVCVMGAHLLTGIHEVREASSPTIAPAIPTAASTGSGPASLRQHSRRS